jgi:hypothetical protein
MPRKSTKTLKRTMAARNPANWRQTMIHADMGTSSHTTRPTDRQTMNHANMGA